MRAAAFFGLPLDVSVRDVEKLSWEITGCIET
jgi:hypothetical protein